MGKKHQITVGDLIRELKGYDKWLPVMVSSDAEGNAINAAGDVSQESELDHGEDACVVIWPT